MKSISLPYIFAAALSVLGFSTAQADTSAKTQYPIVLVHGMAGFDSIIGINYFYQVPSALRSSGATVLVASMSSFNSNEVRGEQLLKQLKEWSAAKGYTKFNLITHSQGGPTARYVHGVAPGLIASISTVAGTHDLSQVPENTTNDLLTKYAKVIGALGSFIAWESGSSGLPQDPVAVNDFVTHTAQFNAKFPAGQPSQYCGQGAEKVGNTYFYSVTGNQVETNKWDLTDGLIASAAKGYAGIASDGLVPVCAAHWGKVLRDD